MRGIRVHFTIPQKPNATIIAIKFPAALWGVLPSPLESALKVDLLIMQALQIHSNVTKEFH
jgi:hypothetical protein